MDSLNSFKKSREFSRNQRRARNKSKYIRDRRNAQIFLPLVAPTKLRSISSHDISYTSHIFNMNNNKNKIRINDKNARRFQRSIKKKKITPILPSKQHLLRRISAPATSPISKIDVNNKNTKPIINVKIATSDDIGYIINNINRQHTRIRKRTEYYSECKSYNLDHVNNNTVHTSPSLPKSSTSPLLDIDNEPKCSLPATKTYTQLKKAVSSKKRNKKGELDDEFSLQNRKVTRGSFVRNLHKFAMDEEKEFVEIAVSMNTEDNKKEQKPNRITRQSTMKPGKVLRFKKRYEDRVFKFDQNTRSRQATLSKLKQDIGSTVDDKRLKSLSSAVKDYIYDDGKIVSDSSIDGSMVGNKHLFTNFKDWHSFLQLQQKWMTQKVLHFSVIQREMSANSKNGTTRGRTLNEDESDNKEEDDVFVHNIEFSSVKNSEEYSFANEKLFVHQLRLWIETYGVPSIAITNEVLDLKKDLVRVNEEANELEDECVQLYLKVYQLEEKLENNRQSTDNLQRNYLLLKKRNIATTVDLRMLQQKYKNKTPNVNNTSAREGGSQESTSLVSNCLQSPVLRTAVTEGHNRKQQQNKQCHSSTISGMSSKYVSAITLSWEESDNSEFDVIRNGVRTSDLLLSYSNSNNTGKRNLQYALELENENLRLKTKNNEHVQEIQRLKKELDSVLVKNSSALNIVKKDGKLILVTSIEVELNSNILKKIADQTNNPPIPSKIKMLEPIKNTKLNLLNFSSGNYVSVLSVDPYDFSDDEKDNEKKEGMNDIEYKQSDRIASPIIDRKMFKIVANHKCRNSGRNTHYLPKQIPKYGLPALPNNASLPILPQIAAKPHKSENQQRTLDFQPILHGYFTVISCNLWNKNMLEKKSKYYVTIHEFLPSILDFSRNKGGSARTPVHQELDYNMVPCLCFFENVEAYQRLFKHLSRLEFEYGVCDRNFEHIFQRYCQCILCLDDCCVAGELKMITKVMKNVSCDMRFIQSPRNNVLRNLIFIGDKNAGFIHCLSAENERITSEWIYYIQSMIHKCSENKVQKVESSSSISTSTNTGTDSSETESDDSTSSFTLKSEDSRLNIMKRRSKLLGKSCNSFANNISNYNKYINCAKD